MNRRKFIALVGVTSVPFPARSQLVALARRLAAFLRH